MPFIPHTTLKDGETMNRLKTLSEEHTVRSPAAWWNQFLSRFDFWCLRTHFLVNTPDDSLRYICTPTLSRNFTTITSTLNVLGLLFEMNNSHLQPQILFSGDNEGDGGPDADDVNTSTPHYYLWSAPATCHFILASSSCRW